MSDTQVQERERSRLDQVVRSFNSDGDETAYRIVDLYHPGTSKWLHKHLTWATHKGFETVVSTPTEEEVSAYVNASIERLRQQFPAAVNGAGSGVAD